MRGSKGSNDTGEQGEQRYGGVAILGSNDSRE